MMLHKFRRAMVNMGREPLRGFETLLELGTVRRPVPYLKIEVVLTFPGRLSWSQFH
jgi:hypothetical protein